jgi:hypothetical protein
LALLAKKGSFNKTAGPTTGNQSITGVGFTPKVLIIWRGGSETAGTWGQDSEPTFGFAVGTADADQRSINMRHNDAQTVGDTARIGDDKIIVQTDSAAATVGVAALVTLGSDGFTINWTTNDAANPASLFHYLALGGDDITAAKVVQWTLPTSPGAVQVTGVGFRPDFVMHLYYEGTAFGGTAGVGSAGAVGFMAPHNDPNVVDAPNISARSIAWSSSDGSAAAVAKRDWSQQPLNTIALAGTALHVSDRTASSFDPDGFTIDFDSTSGATLAVASLCIQGIAAHVRNDTKDTGAAPVSQTMATIPFKPVAVMCMGIPNNTPTSSPAAGAMIGFGASDGTTEGYSLITDVDGADPTECDGLDKTDKFYGVSAQTVAQSIAAECDLTSIDANGITVNWTTNDATARRLLFAYLGSRQRKPPQRVIRQAVTRLATR